MNWLMGVISLEWLYPVDLPRQEKINRFILFCLCMGIFCVVGLIAIGWIAADRIKVLETQNEILTYRIEILEVFKDDVMARRKDTDARIKDYELKRAWYDSIMNATKQERHGNGTQ